MVVNRSIEQGIVTLFVLAMQKGHTPVDSFTLSTVMGVSDSYLRKILQRLSRAGIVISVAGRQGGFVLARPLDQITTGLCSRPKTGARGAMSGPSRWSAATRHRARRIENV